MEDEQEFTTLADLQSGAVKACLMVRGKQINITIDPDSITGDMLRDMQRNTPKDEAGQVEQLAEVLATVIISWDLGETKRGPVVPLTVERLMKFGISLLNEIANAMKGVARLGESTGTPSQRRSLPTGTSRSRNYSSR